jgi:hypothetical protein
MVLPDLHESPLTFRTDPHPRTDNINLSEKEKKMTGRKIVPLYAVAAVFILLWGGCASNGALSTQKITTGEKAILEAMEGNATLTAAAELNAAEGNLNQAREAYAKKEYEKASRLADRASIDAEYARNKATTEKAKKRVEEMRGNIDTLRQEIDRLSKQ